MEYIFMLRLERRHTIYGRILSLLRDGGELSLMNGDNNLGRINLPRLWSLFFRNVNTYRVTS